MDARPARRAGLRSVPAPRPRGQALHGISALPPTAQSAMVTIYSSISWWFSVGPAEQTIGRYAYRCDSVVTSMSRTKRKAGARRP